MAPVKHRAHHVVALIHTTAKAKAELLRWRRMLSHERMALHVGGRLRAGDADQGGGEVDETNEPVAATAGFVFGRREVLELLRYMDDQRHI